MKITPTAIPEVLVLEPQVYGDERGFFFESFNQRRFEELTGQRGHFVQDNHSRSARNVLRGLHYQIKQPQGKLVRVTSGAIFDVVVDLRRGSPTFGEWEAVELDDVHGRQLWIPIGFGHGFCVLSEEADFVYKCTAYYDGATEAGIRFDDPDVGVEWPGDIELLYSERDRTAPRLSEVADELPFAYGT